MFSDSSDQTLQRYFSFHLEGIREISDTLFEAHGDNEQIAQLQQELISLIDYQRKYFRKFFDEDAIAPKAYYRNLIETLAPAVALLTNDLQTTAADTRLKECVLSYMDDMLNSTENATFTYKALFYFESVVVALHGLHLAKASANINQRICDQLSALNFNHLGFFTYRRQQLLSQTDDPDLWKKLEKLQDEFTILKYHPDNTLSYDPAWPPLGQMLSGWITDEINYTREKLRAENAVLHEKLGLNVSVAQLAFLAKLLFQENLCLNPNLSAVFKFFSRNFEAKRQKLISAGSFSKEFYSTSQVTAAVVRDLLLKMVARINRDFFPVMAAAVAAFGVLQGIR
ncbi:MAG: hypothetical protein M3O71_15465 [Bacteroidota bacterium]|nr:hypothetical protein [Bacteroidota bacterium]